MAYEFLKIDPFALDKEWIKQATLVMEYQDQLAGLRRSLAKAKIDAEVEKHETAQLIRSEPEKYGLEKTTVAAVDQAVNLELRRSRGRKALIDLEHRIDIVTGILRALDHKKSALQSLVSLHGQAYFAEPRGEREDIEAAREEIRTQRLIARTQRKTNGKKEGSPETGTRPPAGGRTKEKGPRPSAVGPKEKGRQEETRRPRRRGPTA